MVFGEPLDVQIVMDTDHSGIRDADGLVLSCHEVRVYICEKIIVPVT